MLQGNIEPGGEPALLIDPGDDLPYDPRDFSETRAELRVSGHNLTSVLVNPRETYFDDLFKNEFSSEQRAPISSAVSSTGPSPGSALSSSSSSSSAHSGSFHSMSSSSHHASSSSKHYSSSQLSFQLLQISKLEEKQMLNFVDRIRGPFEELIQAQQSAQSHLLHSDCEPDPRVETRGDVDNMTRPSLYSSRINQASPADTLKGITSSLERCLGSMPVFLFGSEFSLTNLEMFQWSIGASSKGTKANQYNGGNNINRRRSDDELFEQTDALTKLLDNVEITLLQYIWAKSPYFFGVIEDVRSLQLLVSQLQKEIALMRSRLDSMCSQLSLTIMRIPKLHRRQSNETALHHKLISMQRVLDGRQAIQKMLEIEDFWGALDLCSEIRNIYNIDLHRIASMKSIGRELDECDVFICEVMCNKFVSVSMQWETLVDGALEISDANISNDSNNNSNSRTSSSTVSSSTSKANSSPSENRTLMFKLIESLVAVEKFKPALNSYKIRLSDSIRLIIRTCVMEYLSLFDPTGVVDAISQDIQEDMSNSQFSKQISSMPNDRFLACLCMIFEHVVIALSRADSVTRFVRSQLSRLLKLRRDFELEAKKYVFDFDNKSATSSSEIAIENSKILLLESLMTFNDSCIVTAGELAHRSISQMLGLRKDPNVAVKMTVENMMYFWRISTSFLQALEKLEGSASHKMWQLVLNQSKLFLESLHDDHKSILVNTLDNERWVQYDISPERQAEIENLMGGRAAVTRCATQRSAKAVVFTVAGMRAGGGAVASTSSASSSEGIPQNSNSTGVEDLENSAIGSSANNIKVIATAVSSNRSEYKPLVIDGVSYNVAFSLLKLIDLCLVYVDIMICFPSVSSDLTVKIVELLRLFDSRTRQLVLGAQAINASAHLKSISAKHLAIAAQSLSLLRALLPHIRTVLTSQIPAKQHMLLTDYDKVSYEIVDHHGQIVGKFVAIVSDMVDSAAMKLKGVNWDRFQGQCEYFEEVLKNISALHRVLVTILPFEQLQDVFSRIFALLNRKIPHHFEDIMPSTLTGKQRIVDEVVHMSSSFEQLKHINHQNMTVLEDIFRKKYGIMVGS